MCVQLSYTLAAGVANDKHSPPAIVKRTVANKGENRAAGERLRGRWKSICTSIGLQILNETKA